MLILPMLAESMADGIGIGLLGAGLGAGLATLGPSIGIGRLVTGTVESQARQPEVGGRVFTTMIVGAALIEGFTFFALIICLIFGFRLLGVLQGAGH